MSAGTDLIFFDSSEDWQSVVNTSRDAVRLPGDRFVPIPAFDLGVTLETNYIAVIAGSTEVKSSWFFAGDIAQVYDFAPGGGNPVLGKIQPQRTRLAINRLQLVETNRVSTDPFRLNYKPPYWFKDCTIKVYAYTGDKLNFVEDSLFNIGNALGIDPNQSESLIGSQLQIIKELITDRFNDLQISREAEEQLDNLREADLQVQINQLDAGIYTVTEAVAELLPPERGDNYKQAARNRLDLDLGFL